LLVWKRTSRFHDQARIFWIIQYVVQRGSQKVDHVQSESTKSKLSDIGLIFFNAFYPVDVYWGFDILDFSAPNKFTIAEFLNTLICF